VRLFDGAANYAVPAHKARYRYGRRGLPRVLTRKIGVQKPFQVLRVEVPRQGQHPVGGSIEAAHIACDLLPREGGDVLLGSRDGSAQGVIPVEGLVQEVAHALIGSILHHRDLLGDDAFLLLDLLRIQKGVVGQVEENVQSQGQVLVHHAGVEARALAGGEGIQVAPHFVHRLGDIQRRALMRAFKHHVLDEMRYAVLPCGFVQGSGFHPQPYGNGPAVAGCLAPHAEAVGISFLILHGNSHLYGISPILWQILRLCQETMESV